MEKKKKKNKEQAINLKASNLIYSRFDDVLDVVKNVERALIACRTVCPTRNKNVITFGAHCFSRFPVHGERCVSIAV